MAYNGIVISEDTLDHSSIQVTSTLYDNISRVLNTLPGERTGNPEFGSRVKAFFFDPDNIPVFTVENEIKSSLEKWIPYITINSITSSSSEGVYTCTLSITDNTTNTTTSLSVGFV